MRQAVRLSLLLGVIAGVCAPLAARAADGPPAPTSGYRAEYLTALEDVQGKLLDLAQAMPADKFGWRPAEGVRSVAEVYGHVAGGNYFIPTYMGVKAPDSVSRDLERETDKGKVIAALRSSLEYVRQVVLQTSDAGLEKKVKLFGHDATVREVLSLLMNHMHEHLGQSIAYARMCGVVPPWTAREQAAAAVKKPARKP